MGIGLGIVIATLCMMWRQSTGMTQNEIEQEARTNGMIYESECRVIGGELND